MVGPSLLYAAREDRELFDAWEHVDWVSTEADAESLARTARAHGARKLVLDDYRIDEDYQLSLRADEFKWLQFEARMDRPIWADIVLNVNLAATPDDYAEIIRHPSPQFLLGPRYAILRPEFAAAEHRDPSRPVRNILLAFGGGDDRGAIAHSLEALVPNIDSCQRILIISGQHNPRLRAIEDWMRLEGHQHQIDLVVDPPNVATCLAACDLAIMGGGTMTYEAACCRVPMILMALAGNQVAQAQAWHANGGARYLGALKSVSLNDISSAFREFSKADTLARARQSLSVVDGKGAMRVALAVQRL